VPKCRLRRRRLLMNTAIRIRTYSGLSAKEQLEQLQSPLAATKVFRPYVNSRENCNNGERKQRKQDYVEHSLVRPEATGSCRPNPVAPLDVTDSV
jgi:hypothetical protein